MSDPKNPYDICIWNEKSDCESCSLNGKLQCHKDSTHSWWFLGGYLCYIVPIIVGMIFLLLSNMFLFLIALIVDVGYMIFFFAIWEPRILCRHCPFYAESDTKILHCYANYGFYKPVEFTPNPMTRSERIQFITGFLLFLIVPIIFLIIGLQYLMALLAGVGSVIWALILSHEICVDCINFSCPLNKVPEEMRNEFLKKNPVMKEAWEKAGFDLSKE
ncbi:MAG: hypothetical protein ACXQS8_03410 [Candidatus Helarchaeales archaeon]